MYIFFNPNPAGLLVGDCVIRALARALKQDWETTYMDICLYGLMMHNMPSANSVWGAYLKDKGFRKHIIPDICPDCYTVKDFCKDYYKGLFILCTGTHVVTVIDGDYYDTWDSGDEIPLYYWKRED